jgi:Tfp pilus assembly protein PilE
MNNRKFTLVEFIVVIGIIGVLTALLTPALIQVRDKTRCINICSQLNLEGKEASKFEEWLWEKGYPRTKLPTDDPEQLWSEYLTEVEGASNVWRVGGETTPIKRSNTSVGLEEEKYPDECGRVVIYLNHNDNLCFKNVTHIKYTNDDKFIILSTAKGYNYKVNNEKVLLLKTILNIGE